MRLAKKNIKPRVEDVLEDLKEDNRRSADHVADTAGRCLGFSDDEVEALRLALYAENDACESLYVIEELAA